jgi:hypothetical protein
MQNFIMRPTRAIATAAALFLIAVLLVGCSAARLAYNNGEMLSYWWLNGYVEFNGDQTPRVKKEIAALFDWHRKTQLQYYVQFLQRAQERVPKGVSEAELRNDYDEIKKHVLVLTDKALPAMAELALSLQPEQIDNIEKKFAANNDKYRKDYLNGSLEKRQRFRYKKTLQQAENWFGSFSEEQMKEIRTVSDARPLNNEWMLADRMQRQAATIALLRKIQSEKPSREAAASMIRSHVVAILDRSGASEHKEFLAAYSAGTVRLVAFIINRSTPEQKAYFIKAAQKWIDDFNAVGL